MYFESRLFVYFLIFLSMYKRVRGDLFISRCLKFPLTVRRNSVTRSWRRSGRSSVSRWETWAYPRRSKIWARRRCRWRRECRPATWKNSTSNRPARRRTETVWRARSRRRRWSSSCCPVRTNANTANRNSQWNMRARRIRTRRTRRSPSSKHSAPGARP